MATLVNTPPTFGPVYYAAWKVGRWVPDEPIDDAHTPTLLAQPAPPAVATAGNPPETVPDNRSWWHRWGETVTDIDTPVLVGTVIFSVGFSLQTYGLVSTAWHWRVRLKRRRRQSARPA